MAGPGGAAQRTEKVKRGGLAGFVIGMVMGALGAVFLPGLVAPYLPDALRGEQVQVAGVVEAKATEGTRLLLTVGSEAGATLVTFRDDIAEIDLLVSVGDSVLLSVDEYAPFIDDAKVSRVMKPRDWREARPIAVDTAAEPDATLDTAARSDTAIPETTVIDGIAVDTATPDTTTGAADTDPSTAP